MPGQTSTGGILGTPTETLWRIIGEARQTKRRLWPSSSSAARMTPPAQGATFSPAQAAWQTSSTPIERKSARAFFRIVKLPQYARKGGSSAQARCYTSVESLLG